MCEREGDDMSTHRTSQQEAIVNFAGVLVESLARQQVAIGKLAILLKGLAEETFSDRERQEFFARECEKIAESVEDTA